MKIYFQYFCFLLYFMVNSATAQHKQSGVVYEDRNANQKFDAGEKGIPNVGVSNGIDVVMTDAEGRYSLPASSDQIFL